MAPGWAWAPPWVSSLISLAAWAASIVLSTELPLPSVPPCVTRTTEMDEK